ncbi:MAG: hypothetical protein AAF917_01505 [Pseudomonadota bacterium]
MDKRLWSMGTSSSLFVMVGFLIGLALFVVTAMLAWSYRDDPVVRRSASFSAGFAPVAGIAGVAIVVTSSGGPWVTTETVVLLSIIAAAAFTASFHAGRFFVRRSAQPVTNDDDP